jgi:hypothetical protein
MSSGIGKTQNAALRIVLELMNDEGSQASQTLDECFTLSGYTVTRRQVVSLAPAAIDEAVTFTDAIALILVTKDYDFDLRMAAGETLLENLRFFTLWAYDTDEGVHQTSVLLTGNTTNTALVEVWTIEKP